MFQLFEPATRSGGRDRIQRSPAVPVVGALASGIAVDHSLGLRFELWWMGALLALALAVFCWTRRFSLVASVAILVACAATGGCWHHWRWHCLAFNDISTLTSDQARPIRLMATVIQGPLVLKSNPVDLTPWQSPERTVTVIACDTFHDSGENAVPVSGHVRLTIMGRADDLAIGDRIEIFGVLTRPKEPSNPGEFDNRKWMRSQGLSGSIIAEFPEAVQIVGHDHSIRNWFARIRFKLRRRAEHLIASRLNDRTAPVAQSLLLGGRVEFDRELRRAFAESGTLHVLAISGMNVGLLWMWIWRLCRTIRISPKISLLVVLLALPAYAVITDANPPVVRATIVAMILACGQLGGRKDSRWNSLAVAAVFVLAWNPSDLFNAGAQLSFMAVISILLTTGFLSSFQVADPSDDGNASRRLLHRSAISAAKFVGESIVVSVGVWVMTSPLMASQFHLIAPIGVLLNIVLGPLIAVMFWLGYSFLLLGMVSPFLFGWLAVPFEWTLKCFLTAIEAAAKVDLGHNYMPAPPGWWIAGFYALLLTLVFLDYHRGRIFWSARAVLAWSVFGLAICMNSPQSPGLSCTILSVSHGLSVLIECPNGRTLLYDAGSMNGGAQTARAIESALWHAGKTRLDAVVISHADADHCNALPELLEAVPIQTLLVHRTFLDWRQPPIEAAIERPAAHNIPIRLISAGQSLQLDPTISITVLHPAANFRGAADNSNSVVLCLEYAGRRFLLTGDLERDGLVRFLQSDPLDVDILLSPHHGSPAANTTDLARWATTEKLIVSCRDDYVTRRLAPIFGDSVQILTTARYGAIRCRIGSDGGIRIDPFKRADTQPAEH